MILSKFFSNKLFLILLWFLIILSINTNIDHLVSIETLFNQGKLKDNLNPIRLYLSISVFFFLLGATITNKTIGKNFYLSVIIFICYQLVQIFSLLFSENNNSNIIYNVHSLNVLLFLNIYLTHCQNKIKNLLVFSFSILFFLFLVFHFITIIKMFALGVHPYGYYESTVFFVDNAPRSSGIARIGLCLFVFSHFFLIKKMKKLSIFFSSILFIPSIFLNQSRTILAIFIIILLIIFVLELLKKNRSYKFYLNQLFYYLLLPSFFTILIFISSNFFYKNILSQYTDSKIYLFTITKIIPSKDLRKIINLEDEQYIKHYAKTKVNKTKTNKMKLLRTNDNKSFSSQRFRDWKNIAILTNQNFLFGYGTQADRFLIQQTASNALLYAYSSAGIFGLLSILFIYLRYFYIFLKSIKVFPSSSSVFLFSYIILIVFFLRSIFESSFAVFGIDFILFALAIYNIEHEYKKYQG
ncbi:hypothetical protein SAR11G3_00035 [Candidatus Pelagibacter sp. IMCC9063]|nr:hypothetical protein SAR11G3_00035 [Candidatus Pelagibacter sp. IMCC9063]